MIRGLLTVLFGVQRALEWLAWRIEELGQRIAGSHVRAGFFCLDCGADVLRLREYFMVWDSVWLTANPDDEGMLCLGCLEARLGRRLGVHDFTAAPVNFEAGSLRLQERIFG